MLKADQMLRKIQRPLALAMAFTLACGTAPQPAAIGAAGLETIRAVADVGAGGYGGCPLMSGDGESAILWHEFRPLVPKGNKGLFDVYLHNPRTDEIKRVSVASDGTEGNGNSYAAAASHNGRFIVFASQASNLARNDKNNAMDVFVHDRDADGNGVFDEPFPGATSTERISVAPDGTEGNRDSGGENLKASISSDGRYVVFFTAASNLVPGEDSSQTLILHDRLKNTNEIVSRDIQGNKMRAPYLAWFIQTQGVSDDGRYVAFLADDRGYVYDRQVGKSELVTIAPDGQAIPATGLDVFTQQLSADGRFFVWTTPPGNGPYDGHAYLRDRLTGMTEMIDVAPDGTPGNGTSINPVISPNGRYLSFESNSTNLTVNANPGSFNIFRYDRITGIMELFSVDSLGHKDDRGLGSYMPAIGDNGAVAFTANDRLAPEDREIDTYDIYLRRPLVGERAGAHLGTIASEESVLKLSTPSVNLGTDVSSARILTRQNAVTANIQSDTAWTLLIRATTLTGPNGATTLQQQVNGAGGFRSIPATQTNLATGDRTDGQRAVFDYRVAFDQPQNPGQYAGEVTYVLLPR